MAGFGFVGTPLDVLVALPREIVPGSVLRKASDEEITFIKATFPQHVMLGSTLRGLFEVDWKTIDDSDDTTTRTSYRPVPLSRDSWRYYVTEFSDNGPLQVSLDRVLRIARPEIEFIGLIYRGVGSTPENWGYGYDIWPFVTKPPIPPLAPTLIDEPALADFQVLHERYQAVAEQYLDIANALKLFYDLRRIPTSSDLYVLGLFAVLEMLLAHRPADRDNADSLRHQISEKLPLVDRRSSWHLDYSPFDGSEPRAIWKRLYDYRSSVAHGTPSAATAVLSKLGGRDTALQLVREGTRLVLRAALMEPSLVEDLKRV